MSCIPALSKSRKESELNRYHDAGPIKPGLQARQRDLAELTEAAGAGSAQGSSRVRRAQGALNRQLNVAEGKPALAPRPKKK